MRIGSLRLVAFAIAYTLMAFAPEVHAKRSHHRDCDQYLSTRQDRRDYFERRDQNNHNRRDRTEENRGHDRNQHYGDVRDQIYADISKDHRTVLSYRDARVRIMHELDAYQDQRGLYVWDYYCQRGYRIHPNQMPNSNELNIEHTWPQSRFSTRFPRDQQKSDLHHLFPTDSWANQLRENMNFGYVEQDTRHTDANCKDSRVGYDKNHRMRFQPPEKHRGSVARALFYFSIRYKLPIDAEQEAILRDWHKADPVSADEIERNNKIEKIQGNRNPFIDSPDLVNKVPRFN